VALFQGINFKYKLFKLSAESFSTLSINFSNFQLKVFEFYTNNFSGVVFAFFCNLIIIIGYLTLSEAIGIQAQPPGV